MPTVGVGLSLRVHGTAEGRKKSRDYARLLPIRINKALEKEVGPAEDRIRSAVQASYTTGEGSGRTARGLELEVRPGKRGASVRLRMAVTGYSKYLTSLLPESDFKSSPYFIFGDPLLRFFWKGGPNGPGIYYARKVLHPGFKRDVIREEAQLELQVLERIVQLEVRDVVTEVFAVR